jgi:hypothetical protein
MNANPLILLVSYIKEATATQKEADLLIGVKVSMIKECQSVSERLKKGNKSKKHSSADNVLLKEALNLCLIVGQVFRRNLYLKRCPNEQTKA